MIRNQNVAVCSRTRGYLLATANRQAHERVHKNHSLLRKEEEEYITRISVFKAHQTHQRQCEAKGTNVHGTLNDVRTLRNRCDANLRQRVDTLIRNNELFEKLQLRKKHHLIIWRAGNSGYEGRSELTLTHTHTHSHTHIHTHTDSLSHPQPSLTYAVDASVRAMRNQVGPFLLSWI